MTDQLPTQVTEMVMEYMAESGADFTDPNEMYGRCEDHTLWLVQHILAQDPGLTEWGDPIDLDAEMVQVWMDKVPEGLAGNEMAGGHFVAEIRYEGEYHTVDLTAAQFPEMGWTGPLVDHDYS